jgi:hypothetical protein
LEGGWLVRRIASLFGRLTVPKKFLAGFVPGMARAWMNPEMSLNSLIQPAAPTTNRIQP